MTTPKRGIGEYPVVVPPKKGSSGEHPALTEVSRRLDENAKILLPELENATQRLTRAVDAATDPPPPLSSPTTGEWVILIRGVGPYHNRDVRDVERLAASFVADARAMGQKIEAAGVSFSDHSVDDLTSPPETLRSTNLKKDG